MCGQALNVGPQGGAQLIFGKSTYCGKRFIKRYVDQVVDGGEDAELRELGDAGDEAKLEVGLVGLERHIELLHDLAHGIERGLVVERIEQRSVVLVDDDHHLPPRLLLGTVDEACEQFARSGLIVTPAINVSEGVHHPHQRLAQPFGIVLPLGHAEIEMEYRVAGPLLFELHDLQPLKKRLVALEVGFQRGSEQRLAEATRAAHENELGIVCHFPYKVGLVDIQVSAIYDFRKGLNAHRVFSHHLLHNVCCCFHYCKLNQNN